MVRITITEEPLGEAAREVSPETFGIKLKPELPRSIRYMPLREKLATQPNKKPIQNKILIQEVIREPNGTTLRTVTREELSAKILRDSLTL